MELSLGLRGEMECGPKSILLCHRVKVSAGAGGRATSPWQMEGMPGTVFPSEPPAGPGPQEGRETLSHLRKVLQLGFQPWENGELCKVYFAHCLGLTGVHARKRPACFRCGSHAAPRHSDRGLS